MDKKRLHIDTLDPTIKNRGLHPVNFVRRNTNAVICLKSLYLCAFIGIMVAAFVSG